MLPASQVFPVNESNGDTGAAGTTGTAGAVQVVLFVFGNRVVDHVGHVVNVDASGGNLGGNQNVFLA